MNQEVVEAGRVNKVDHLILFFLSCVPLLVSLFVVCAE